MREITSWIKKHFVNFKQLSRREKNWVFALIFLVAWNGSLEYRLAEVKDNTYYTYEAYDHADEAYCRADEAYERADEAYYCADEAYDMARNAYYR